MGLITLLIPVITACSLFTSTPKPSQADFEQEEQAVYAVFVGKGPALILKDTSTSVSDEDPQKMINNLKDSLPGISRSTMDNYVERNAQPSQLSTDMQLGAEYTLLSSEELAKISSQPNWHEILREKFPGSNGYLIFSRVGFNNTLDQAVIYVGAVQGPLMGSGSYYLLEKQNGEWKIIKETMVWIS
jgi:hypothetical protein